jgi:hypothetical protein
MTATMAGCRRDSPRDRAIVTVIVIRGAMPLHDH